MENKSFSQVKKLEYVVRYLTGQPTVDMFPIFEERLWLQS